MKGTLNFGLWYSRSKDFTLIAYTYADWIGSIDEKKSTSGGAFFLGGCLVSQLNKNKTSVSLNNKNQIYCSSNMLHTSSLDETNTKGYQGRI
jgi:hypothetical protein